MLPRVSTVITLPRSIVECVRREAEKHGLSLEIYIVDLILQNIDPKNRSIEYIRASRELIEQARKELEEGIVGQATKSAWGSTVLALKAYAWARENRRLFNYSELWDYSLVLARELGEWVIDVWVHANSMHTCFYEEWCKKEHVETVIKHIEKLINVVELKVKLIEK